MYCKEYNLMYCKEYGNEYARASDKAYMYVLYTTT